MNTSVAFSIYVEGRVVFQGSIVLNQNYEVAKFHDMANAPATLEASVACDLYGCLPSHVCWQADPEQAYCQSHLGDCKTRIRLPKDRWPKKWYNEDGVPLYDDPVCPVILALYGHPKSV